MCDLSENKGFTDFQNTETATNTEAATRCVLCKKVFLEISQNSQENTYARVFFFDKTAGLLHLLQVVQRRV